MKGENIFFTFHFYILDSINIRRKTERVEKMKKFLAVLLVSALLLPGVPETSAEILYGRTREEPKNEQPEEKPAEPTVPTMPASILDKLAGTLIVKVGKDTMFENGKGKKIDSAPFDKDGNIYIPLADAAVFFGKKALWNSESRTVSIDEKIIYPGERSLIKNGRTMVAAELLTELFGVQLLYSNDGIMVFGKNAIEEETATTLTDIMRDTLYVVPESTKNGDGTPENPYGGIENAVLAVREKIKNGMISDINVILRGGLYTLHKGLEFTSEDSGKNGYKIIYQSYPEETAEIAGADRITNWHYYKDGIYKAKIDTSETVNMVYENDAFAVKARYPNVGESFRDSYLKSAGEYKNDSKKFYFNNGDIPYISDTTGLQTALFGGGSAGIYNWVFEVHGAEINFRDNVLSMNASPRYVMGKGSRYFIQGAKELLDAEGEFWYDEQNKTIYYKPYNDDIKAQTITYATTMNPIKITGKENRPVENISFRGLKIGKSNMLSEWGEGGAQYANTVTYANNCSFEDCEFLYTGGTALVFKNCNDCTVKGNYMHNLGSGAVAVANNSFNGEIKYKNIVITDNYIDNIGIVKRDSSAITLSNADKNTVTYNTIKNITRMGISFGTGVTPEMLVGKTINGVKINEIKDGFEFVNTRENYIAYNDISQCMTDTQDGGPIYTWAAGKGNRVENNHIHDSNIYFSVGYGIYGDDATTYAEYRKNIIDNLQKEGAGTLNAVMITKGVGHQIVNNFFLNNPSAALGAFSTETKLHDEHNDLVYIKNITMNSSDQLHGQWKWYDDRFRICNYNFYYNDSGKYLIYNNDKAKDLEEWKKINTDYGYMDTVSISGENPNFVDYENGDYRLRYDSKAYSLGIEDIAEKNIGVTDKYKFADCEEEIKKLYLETEQAGESANVRLNSGEKAKINVSARTVSGYFANLDNAEITFSSDNKNVADVDSRGIVIAKDTGIAAVRVKAVKNGKMIESVLYILVNDRFESVKAFLTKNIADASRNEDAEIISAAYSEMGYSIPVGTYTYKSLNEKVATVDSNGKITSVGAGKTDIVVSATYKGITHSTSVPLTVLNGVLDKINIEVEKNDAILIGETIPITVTAQLTTGETVDNSLCKISYQSDNENVMKVGQDGVMHAVGEGRCAITVYMEKDGYKINKVLHVAVYEKYSGILKDGFKEINFGTSHGYADFSGDKLIIRSTGKDFWGGADDGYYLYKEYSNKSNLSMEMTLESLLKMSTNTSVGLSIRESAEADSRNVTIRATAGGGFICLWRDEKGGNCNYVYKEGAGFPLKMKLEKRGADIYLYADKGNGYELLASHGFSASTFTVGIPLFAQSENDLSTEAVIKDFTINE